MTTPTDHELNEVLARVAGVEIEEETILDGNLCRAKIWVHDLSIWDPCHDANQMEQVKAALRENGVYYSIIWDFMQHHIELLAEQTSYWGHAPSELRAFALAVAAWWNEQKKEKAT